MASAATIDRMREMTNRVISSLEGGVVPWRDSRLEDGLRKPGNVVSGLEYKGVNYFQTMMAIRLNGWRTGWFGSYLQWQQHDCVVREGQRSVPIVKWFSQEDEVEPTPDAPENVRRREGHKWFHVFNLDQVDAIGDVGREFLQSAIMRVGVSVEPLGILNPIPVLEALRERYDLPLIDGHQSFDKYYIEFLNSLARQTSDPVDAGDIGAVIRQDLVNELAAVYVGSQHGVMALRDVGVDNRLRGWVDLLRSDERFLMSVMRDATQVARKMQEVIG